MFYFNEVLMQYKTIKISRIHEDYKILANRNAILHLILIHKKI